MTEALEVRCTVRDATRVGEALTLLGWGTLWIDEPLAQHTDDDGYVLDAPDPDAPATVHAWPTDETTRPAMPASVLGFAVERVDGTPNEVDWTVAWQTAHATRVDIAPGWVIVPPWQASALVPGERALVVEPGGAFGTGEHPTTRDALRMLHAAMRPGARVLDLGTGSGVLAIAAVRWGAGEVLAVDLQHDAVGHVARNMALNGLAREAITVRVEDLHATLRREARPWDIVLCNVGSTELERALSDRGFDATTTVDGTLIASGLFAPSEARIVATAAEVSLSVVARREEDQWVTLALRRRP